MGESGQAASNLRVVLKHPAELPAKLIFQKEWNGEEYFRWAREFDGDTIWGIELYEEGREEPSALSIQVYNSVYNGVAQDTIIIDRERRGVKNLRQFLRSFEACGVALARRCGATHLTGATSNPKAMLRVLGNPEWHIAESTLRRNL